MFPEIAENIKGRVEVDFNLNMPIYQQIPFTPAYPNKPLDLASDIPKELDIFFQNEGHFLPEGKTFAELTKDESDQVRNRFRFSHYRPGIYQGITGMGNMI